MVLNWIISVADALLLSVLLRKSVFDVKIEDDSNANDIDLETGKEYPVLDNKQEYYDPITGVRVESYYEDQIDE